MAFHKQLFFAAIAVVLGLTGWAVTNLDKHWSLFGATALAVILSGLFGLSQYKRMNQLLKEIENA